MAGVGTYLKVIDNSGAVVVQCIRVKDKKFDNSFGLTIGRLLTVVVKKALIYDTVKRRKFAKKSEIYPAVFVHSSFGLKRFTGTNSLKFFVNSVILLRSDDRRTPLGTRVLHPVPAELKSQGFLKIVSLSPDIY